MTAGRGTQWIGAGALFALGLCACGDDGGETTAATLITSDGTTAGEDTETGPGTSTETETETATDTEDVPQTGFFEKLDLGENVGDVHDVYTPRTDYVFFATDAGVVRIVKGERTLLDLGCDCTVYAFDRTSGFALGIEGEPSDESITLYAGVFDNLDNYNAFPWETERWGQIPREVRGGSNWFIYTTNQGNLYRYDPDAVFGEANLGTFGPWGDAVESTGTFAPLGGNSLVDFHVGGFSGTYRYDGVFTEVFEYSESMGYRVNDLWISFHERWFLLSDRMEASGGGQPQLVFEVELGPVESLTRGVFGNDDRWALGRRADAGSGTGADPYRWGAFLVHHVGSDVQRIEFPNERELTGIAANKNEIYLSGPNGAAYRCRFPDCDVPEAAPLE